MPRNLGLKVAIPSGWAEGRAPLRWRLCRAVVCAGDSGTDPSSAGRARSRARIDPAPVTRADWGVGIESSQAGIDPTPPDIESSRVGIDPAPASIDPDSTGIDPSPVRVKSSRTGIVIFC